MIRKINDETRYKWNEQCKYEERYIALVDILGFSKWVYDESKNHVFAGILHSLGTLPTQHEAKGTGFERIKTAIISDTLVLSATTSSPTALSDIIYCTYSAFRTFLSEGIMLRGAICRGKLYHEDNIVFGPAMVEAHLLEQHIAIYPRIVLSSQTSSDFFEHNADIANAFIEDTDGIIYLDLYGDMIAAAYAKNDCSAPTAIQNIVYDNLRNSSNNEKIRQKYLWVKEHFNRSLKEQRALGKIDSEAFASWVISD